MGGGHTPSPLWHLTRHPGYRMTYRRDDWVGAVLPAVARTAAMLLTGVTVATGLGAVLPGLGRFLMEGLADIGGAEHLTKVLQSTSQVNKKWINDYRGRQPQRVCGRRDLAVDAVLV